MHALHRSATSSVYSSAVKSAEHFHLNHAASCLNTLHAPRQRHGQQTFFKWSSDLKCSKNENLDSPPGSFGGGTLSSAVGHGRKKGQLQGRKGVRSLATSGSLLQEAPLNGHEKNEGRRRQPRVFKGLKASEFQHPLDRQVGRGFKKIMKAYSICFNQDKGRRCNTRDRNKRFPTLYQAR